MDILSEDNKSIETIIHVLDKKVVELRNSKKLDKNHEIYKYIQKIYNEEIIPWMEDYTMKNIEPNIKFEEYMSNVILDMINAINIILRK